MVQSTATTVDAFLATVEPDRREALGRLRDTCRTLLTGWEERMQWGMPGYGPVGADAVVSFNSQKNHIAFYAGPTAVERFRSQLTALDLGKGCIRYKRPEAMDFEVIAAILKDVRTRSEAMC